MNTYLMASGIALNAMLAIFILFIAWVWAIWPLVEAISLTRCWLAIAKKQKAKRGLKTVLHVFWYWYCDVFGGRGWERIHNGNFEWEGVGKWTVFTGEED